MDQKRTWLRRAVVLGLPFLGIQVVLPRRRKKSHWVDEPSNPGNPPPNVAATSPSSGPTTAPIFTTGPTTAPTTVAGPIVKGGESRQILIGDMRYDPKGRGPNGSYPLGLQLSTRGASLLSATRSRFKQAY